MSFDFLPQNKPGDHREHAAFGPAAGIRSVRKVGEKYELNVGGEITTFWAADGAILVDGEDHLAVNVRAKNLALNPEDTAKAGVAVRSIRAWTEAIKAMVRRFRHLDRAQIPMVSTGRGEFRTEQRRLVGQLYLAMRAVREEAERQGDVLSQKVADYHQRHKTGSGHQILVPDDLFAETVYDNSEDSTCPPPPTPPSNEPTASDSV